MAKFIVTGGLGFIGSNLAKRLVEDDNEVIIVDNLMKNYGGNLHNISNFSKNITWHSYDIRDVSSIKKILKDIDIIFNLAGVHHLPEVTPNAWRCLFRGAQLPGYAVSKGISKNMFKTGYQLAYVLPMQIEFIQNTYPDAEFYMSTNVDKDGSGKSIRSIHWTIFWRCY